MKIEVDNRFIAAGDRGHYLFCGDSASKLMSFIFFYLRLSSSNELIQLVGCSSVREDYVGCIVLKFKAIVREDGCFFRWSASVQTTHMPPARLSS